MKNLKKHLVSINSAIDQREFNLVQSLIAEPVRRSTRVRDKVREQDAKSFVTYVNRYEYE